MRKLTLIVGIVFLLFGFQLWDDGLTGLYKTYPEAAVCFYADTEIRCSAAEAPHIRKQIKNIKGESFVMQGDLSLASQILEIYAAKVFVIETLYIGSSVVTIFYARSPYLSRSQKVNGHYINLQIAHNDATDTVTAGTPLILGGY